MNKTSNIITAFILLIVCTTAGYSQNDYKHYLDTAVVRLLQGKCEKATGNYNVYKDLTQKTDVQLENMLKKCVTGQEIKITAKIDSVWCEHNVVQDNMRGMKIHIKFSTYNMLYIKGAVSAYFYLKDGTKLKDTNKKYCSESGQVSVGSATYDDYIFPSYENSLYRDYVLFMPTDEFHISEKGKHDLKFHIAIFEYHTGQWLQLNTSDWQYITFTLN
jgi:hypothetical protein